VTTRRDALQQPRKPRPRSLAAANDEAALRWAGPFGWAVLETLRRGEDFGEADFWDAMGRTPRQGEVTMAPPGEVRVRSSTGEERTLSLENPYGSPDFVGDPEAPPGVRVDRPSTTAPSPVTEPAPPPEFYKRVTTAGRPGQPPAPAGRRDASGRFVRPAR